MRAHEFTINIPISIKFSGSGTPDISNYSSQDTDQLPVGKFVPPLQQKLEILKKSAGLDNVFDQEAQDDDGPMGD